MTASYPRAVRHFGLAAMQEAAARTGQPTAPARAARRTVVRLWLPLTPLFLLLAPFPLLLALLAVPFMAAAPPRYRLDPLRAVIGVGRLLLSLGGTDVDVDVPDARVRIKIF